MKAYRARALTSRAFGYYHLINVYQYPYSAANKDLPGVPLATEETLGQNLPRATNGAGLQTHYRRPGRSAAYFRGDRIRRHRFPDRFRRQRGRHSARPCRIGHGGLGESRLVGRRYSGQIHARLQGELQQRLQPYRERSESDLRLQDDGRPTARHGLPGARRWTLT